MITIGDSVYYMDKDHVIHLVLVVSVFARADTIKVTETGSLNPIISIGEVQTTCVVVYHSDPDVRKEVSSKILYKSKEDIIK